MDRSSSRLPSDATHRRDPDVVNSSGLRPRRAQVVGDLGETNPVPAYSHDPAPKHHAVQRDQPDNFTRSSPAQQFIEPPTLVRRYEQLTSMLLVLEPLVGA